MKALVLCGGVGDRFQPLRKEKFLLSFLAEAAAAAGAGGNG